MVLSLILVAPTLVPGLNKILAFQWPASGKAMMHGVVEVLRLRRQWSTCFSSRNFASVGQVLFEYERSWELQQQGFWKWCQMELAYFHSRN